MLNVAKKDIEPIYDQVEQTGDDKLSEIEVNETSSKISDQIVNDEVCKDQDYEKCVLEKEEKYICSIEV